MIRYYGTGLDNSDWTTVDQTAVNRPDYFDVLEYLFYEDNINYRRVSNT